MRSHGVWGLVPLMILVIGCDLGSDDRKKVVNTIGVLDGILRGESVFDPEVLPSCFKAREALIHSGPQALRQPIVLWAVMRPARRVSSDYVFSLDVAWLTLDDATVAGVYFLSGSGSVPEVVKRKMPLECVDAGTAHSLRSQEDGKMKVIKDLSIETVMRLGLLLVAFDEEAAELIPDEWTTSTIVLPREFASDRKLSFGLLLSDGNLSDPILVLQREQRDVKVFNQETMP